MKLFVKTSTMNRKIKEAELNIIKMLMKSPIDPAIVDEVVDIVSTELESIIETT